MPTSEKFSALGAGNGFNDCIVQITDDVYPEYDVPSSIFLPDAFHWLFYQLRINNIVFTLPGLADDPAGTCSYTVTVPVFILENNVIPYDSVNSTDPQRVCETAMTGGIDILGGDYTVTWDGACYADYINQYLSQLANAVRVQYAFNGLLRRRDGSLVYHLEVLFGMSAYADFLLITTLPLSSYTNPYRGDASIEFFTLSSTAVLADDVIEMNHVDEDIGFVGRIHIYLVSAYSNGRTGAIGDGTADFWDASE